MFFQVNVRKKDQSFLWFPWWPDGDMNKKAVEYCMTVHLFGTVSSPACGNYTPDIQLIVDDHKDEYRYGIRTADTLGRNFYEDDVLNTAST